MLSGRGVKSRFVHSQLLSLKGVETVALLVVPCFDVGDAFSLATFASLVLFYSVFVSIFSAGLLSVELVPNRSLCSRRVLASLIVVRLS